MVPAEIVPAEVITVEVIPALLVPVEVVPAEAPENTGFDDITVKNVEDGPAVENISTTTEKLVDNGGDWGESEDEEQPETTSNKGD